MSDRVGENITTRTGLKVAKDYNYNSSDRYISICDFDLDEVISVFNVTIGRQLYTVGSQALTGTAHLRGEVCYDLIVSESSDSDELYILYKPIDLYVGDSEVREMITELKQINKSLKKILK